MRRAGTGADGTLRVDPVLIAMKRLANRPRDWMISSICAGSWTKETAMSRKAEPGWETATWEGSRRTQLRAALALTVRERLLALEELADLAQRLATMPRASGRSQEIERRTGVVTRMWGGERSIAARSFCGVSPLLTAAVILIPGASAWISRRGSARFL